MARQIFRKILAFLCLLLVHSTTVSSQSLCKPGKDGLPRTPQLSLLSISASPSRLTLISTDLTVYEINSSAFNTTTNQLHLVDVQSEPLMSKWPSLELLLGGKNLSNVRSIFTVTISKRAYLFLLFGTQNDGKEHKNDLILDLKNSSVLPITGLTYPLFTNFPIWITNPISSPTGQLYLLYAQSDKSLLMQQMQSLHSVISYHRFIGKAFPRILCNNSTGVTVSVRFTDITDAENCTIVKWNISRGFVFNGSFFLFEGNKRVFRFAESTYDTNKFVPVTIIPQETFFVCPKVESFPELSADDSASTNASSSAFLTDNGKAPVAGLQILILIFLLLTVALVILVLLCNCQRKYLPIMKPMRSSFNGRSGIHKARGQLSVPTIILSAATKNTMRMVAKAAAAGSICSGGGGKVGSQLKPLRSRGSKLKKKSSKRRPSSKKVHSGGSQAKRVLTGKQTFRAKVKKRSKGSKGSNGSCGTGKVRFTPTGCQARKKKASKRNPCSAGGSVGKATGSQQRRVVSARKRLI